MGSDFSVELNLAQFVVDRGDKGGKQLLQCESNYANAHSDRQFL